MAVLAKQSERKIDRLVNRHLSGYPSFLVKNPGLNNGYMIPQYTAAGLVGEIKVLSHPSSIDNIPTCASRKTRSQWHTLHQKKRIKCRKNLNISLQLRS